MIEFKMILQFGDTHAYIRIDITYAWTKLVVKLLPQLKIMKPHFDIIVRIFSYNMIRII